MNMGTTSLNQGYTRRSTVKGATLAAGAAALGIACKAHAGEASAAKPGIEAYEGSAMGRAGEITLSVIAGNGCILCIDVIENPETATLSDYAIAKVSRDIIQYQTLDVDIVTGATLTSMATINAVRSALGAAGIDTSSFSGKPTYPTQDISDTSCDIVVVGAGSAGMMAALQANEAGLQVIVVEKQGMLGGGDTMFASSGLPGGGGYLAYKAGIENGEQGYLDDKLADAEASGLPVDIDNLTAYSLMTDEALDYYISIGVPFGRFNETSFQITIDDGSAPGVYIIKRLGEQLDRKSIEYRLNTKLVSIVMENGMATGVVVENDTGQYTLGAKGVIIASGGFGYNEDMLTEYADAAGFCGLPHSGAASAMGEGILAAMEAGAAISNMTAIKANCVCHVTENGAVVSLATINNNCALVNDNGERFVSENAASIHERSEAELLQPNKAAWAVFDQKAMDEKALLRNYDALGYFVSGETPEELAANMGFDETATGKFVEVINTWQTLGEGAEDELFGGTIQNSFDTPPFYAARVQPAMQSTYGGITTDAQAHALNEAGEIIPGLYAAGATSGHGCFGNEVGNGLTIAATFGMIAGQTAATEAGVAM